MTDTPQTPQAPIDGAPIWIRMLQATIIGVVAGVALNAILSLVVVQGGGFDTPQDAPKTCKKRAPAKDAGVVPDHPAMSGLTWRIDRSGVGS